jgi:hypothetical protein
LRKIDDKILADIGNRLEIIDQSKTPSISISPSNKPMTEEEKDNYIRQHWYWHLTSCYMRYGTANSSKGKEGCDGNHCVPECKYYQS